MSSSRTTHPRTVALLPAAGLGERLGRGPKGLLRLKDRSLVSWAAEALLGVSDILVVGAPAGFEEAVQAELPEATVVTGGADRQATVRLLLAAADSDLVIVHDAARPFLSVSTARRTLQAAAEHGAASACLPVADTLINRHSGAAVDRAALMAVQTPQAFRTELLKEAHQRAFEQSVSATDDAALVRRIGGHIELVPGSPWLLKLTHPQDLLLAEAMAAAWSSDSDDH